MVAATSEAAAATAHHLTDKGVATVSHLKSTLGLHIDDDGLVAIMLDGSSDEASSRGYTTSLEIKVDIVSISDVRFFNDPRTLIIVKLLAPPGGTLPLDVPRADYFCDLEE